MWSLDIYFNGIWIVSVLIDVNVLDSAYNLFYILKQSPIDSVSVPGLKSMFIGNFLKMLANSSGNSTCLFGISVDYKEEKVFFVSQNAVKVVVFL